MHPATVFLPLFDPGLGPKPVFVSQMYLKYSSARGSCGLLLISSFDRATRRSEEVNEERERQQERLQG